MWARLGMLLLAGDPVQRMRLARPELRRYEDDRR
jgi:hypothetical protein